MKPQSYLDFEAIPHDGEPNYSALAKAVHVLHGVFSGNPEKYAIAFPSAKIGEEYRTAGCVIRVFASSCDDLYDLMKLVGGHVTIRDYMRVTIPRDVPDNFSGKWRAWIRVRVQKEEGINRDKTVARAQKSPFFELASSSGNRFAMRFITLPGSRQTGDCKPGSYGLASQGNRAGNGKNLFYLPEL
jgi:hypothetical protein